MAAFTDPVFAVVSGGIGCLVVVALIARRVPVPRTYASGMTGRRRSSSVTNRRSWRTSGGGAHDPSPRSTWKSPISSTWIPLMASAPQHERIRADGTKCTGRATQS